MSNLFRQLFINLLLSAIFMLTITYIQTPYAAEEYEKPTLTILHEKGYVAEPHTVITEDKYHLELHHILKNYFGEESNRNFPVLIQHCFLGSSADYVINDREKSLPMVLADAGYDVWLSNSRGNFYSRKHEELNQYKKEFWDFSFQELAVKDLPATIDHILKATKKKQLMYVGFSMGTTIFYILAAEMPEYATKTIRAQISLAPAATISHSTSLFKTIAPFTQTLHNFSVKYFTGCLMPESEITRTIMSLLCDNKWSMDKICLQQIFYKVGGKDPEHLDTDLIPYIIGHYPSGTSTKLGVHYSQFILTDVFGQIDLGKTENMRIYDTEEPPLYNLSKIKVPITLIYAENDILSTAEDTLILKTKLKTLMDVIKVNSPLFNHMDFLWAKDVTYHINNPIKESLNIIDHPEWEYSGPVLYPVTIDISMSPDAEYDEIELFKD